MNLTNTPHPALDDGEFTVPLTRAGGAVIEVLMGRAATQAVGISGQRISGTVTGSVGATLLVGELLSTADGEQLEIVAVKPWDHQGAHNVVFSSRGIVSTFIAGDGVLSAIWIDSSRPGFPLDPVPEGDDATILTIKGGASPARVLWQAGPLGLPAGATIDYAELWAISPYTTKIGALWSAHAVPQAMAIAEATWEQFAEGHPWGLPGCELKGTDYSGLGLGDGSGSSGVWQLLASGADLGALLNLHQGANTNLVHRTDSVVGDAQFYSGAAENGVNRPYLKVWYRKRLG